MKVTDHAHLHSLFFFCQTYCNHCCSDVRHRLACLNPITYSHCIQFRYWQRCSLQLAGPLTDAYPGHWGALSWLYREPSDLHSSSMDPNVSCSIIHSLVRGVFAHPCGRHGWERGAPSWPRSPLTCRRDSVPYCSACPVAATTGRSHHCPRSCPKSPIQRKTPAGAKGNMKSTDVCQNNVTFNASLWDLHFFSAV